MDYYLALHKMIERSRKRISMSALYLGTGKLEEFLVEKLMRQTNIHEELRMNILLDYFRGTRINRDGKSSVTLLSNLRGEKFHRDIRIGFYHNPDTGVLKGR